MREQKGKAKKEKQRIKKNLEKKSGRWGSQGTLGWGFLIFGSGIVLNHPLIVDMVEIGIPYHALVNVRDRASMHMRGDIRTQEVFK